MAALQYLQDAWIKVTANTQVGRTNLAELPSLFESLVAAGIRGWQVQLTVAGLRRTCSGWTISAAQTVARRERFPMQSTRIDAGGIGIHFLEAGTGAPALFLHGYPTNAQLWRHVVPAVGRLRRALAIDLPGFGDSDAPNDATYDLAFVHQTIDAVLDTLGIDKLGLCVHDAGGYYGLSWAVAHPERITDLCLLNTLASPAAGFIVRATIGAFQTPGLRDTMVTQWSLRMGMNIGMSRRRLDTHAMSLYTARSTARVQFRAPGRISLPCASRNTGAP
jgi:pimeloyl-ACP methyl ester carboxylesterase